MAREWYFIRKLRIDQLPQQPERFEVQLLDDDGYGIAVGYVGEETKELTISGRIIPPLVIEAARVRIEGDGEYVGPEGQPMPLF